MYDAFISYSHAEDKPIAAALQSVVQSLGKPWYKRRALRIFRDYTSLSATPHLWPTIEAALADSRFLILLASTKAARSMWVGKEVTYWLEQKSTDTLLIAVTDGELAWTPGATDFAWSDATPLPAVLKGRFPHEPKWVDLRAYRAGASKRDRKFTELGADFAAAVHGVPKEDLLSEEVRQQRRALTLAWSAVVILMVLGGVALLQWKAALDAEQVAVEQRLVAEQQRDRATAAEQTANEQRDVAKKQRDRAEHVLTAATNTGNALVSDLAVKFREVKGIPLTVVGGILERGKGLLDDLLSFDEAAPSVQLIAQEPGPNSASRSPSRTIQRVASLSPWDMRWPVSSSAKTPILRASISQRDELQKCWHSCASAPIPKIATASTVRQSNSTRSVITSTRMSCPACFRSS
jgi:MTH538 TIR-like domain (DUF1863)